MKKIILNLAFCFLLGTVGMTADGPPEGDVTEGGGAGALRPSRQAAHDSGEGDSMGDPDAVPARVMRIVYHASHPYNEMTDDGDSYTTVCGVVLLVRGPDGRYTFPTLQVTDDGLVAVPFHPESGVPCTTVDHDDIAFVGLIPESFATIRKKGVGDGSMAFVFRRDLTTMGASAKPIIVAGEGYGSLSVHRGVLSVDRLDAYGVASRVEQLVCDHRRSQRASGVTHGFDDPYGIP